MSDTTLTAPRAQPRQPFMRVASDARLVKLAAEGSTQAFAAIYERHHQEIYRYCRSLLGNEHDARDALQNTMLKALRALEGETREISLRPWLFRIAHNESISLLRRRTPEASIDAAENLAAVEADPETRQRLRNLIADLEQLAPRQRSALVMRELNGLGFDEIGAALETSAAAAKQAVYEARTALHELEEGRDVSCEEIRRKVSAEDRRLLRGRRVRAHLKACSDCRRFEQQTRERSSQLAALAPPLPLPVALGILEGILGGGGGAAGGGGVAGLLGGGGIAGLGGATAAKLGVAAVLMLGAGVIALEENAASPASTAKASEAPEPSAPAAGTTYERDASERKPVAREGGGGSNRGGEDKRAGEQGGGKGNRNGGDNNGGTQVASANESSPAALAPAAGTSSASSSNGGGPASTPPGHGATPPGQGGVPPGLGAPAPGQGGSVPGPGGSAAPPHGGTPPGQGGTPAGQGTTPPQSSSIPGQDNLPAVAGGRN